MSDDAVPPPPSAPPPPPPPQPGRPTPPPPPPPPPTDAGDRPARGPIEVDCDYPEQIARWRPLVHWLLVIPQAIIAAVLGTVAMVVAFIAFFAVLFTRNVPEGMHNLMVMTMRYTWRVNSYSYWMRESYPPFDFAVEASADAPAVQRDPASLGIERPAELNRWLPLVKWILAIPHFLYAIVVGILAFVLLVAAWFAVLFTGKYPRGIFDLLVGIQWWSTRLSAYLFYLRDEYPSFRLGR